MTKRVMENIIGLVFIGSAIAKLLDFNDTIQFLISILGLNFLIVKTALIALSMVEIFIGVSFFINIWKNQIVYSVIISIIVFFILFNVYFFFNSYTNCGCFGTKIESSPLLSLFKNIIILAYLLFVRHSNKKVKLALE
ncbi:MAG: MauE/DoxX family redox-associated membrane protein [Bacteroidota bacterium]